MMTSSGEMGFELWKGHNNVVKIPDAEIRKSQMKGEGVWDVSVKIPTAA